ncbi:hypothetical protein KM029_19850 [Flammeovirga kamogawensis]|uniref:Immunity protein 50 n=1 Tax=Flammeovirga kamogawensis TaxID=373891 RepID=A0ABX8H2S5_9BACT|nr:hypothetical protein [Flammeovirga kamogawensis]QWG09938.1 hypothetical protein KM029_19850 [Flammeovirga kamogawensis]
MIENIFTTFHDGGITGWEGDLKQLTLKIECQYLGKEFQEGFNFFYLLIYNIEHIELEPWMNPITLKKINWTELKDIFKAELEIGYAETLNGIVKVSCNQHNTNYDYCGGNLLIKAKKIEIKNHLKQKITPTDLFKASENYWNKFSNN